MRRILPAVALLAAAPLTAQDAETVLGTAEHTYRTVRTLQASFVQTLRNPMMGDETTTGTLYLEPPHRFSMRFAEPAGDRLVADGDWLWIYTPSTVPDQVIRQPIPESGTATPNLFGQFVDRPFERYRVEYLGADTVGHIAVESVRLIPRVSDLGFRSVVLGLSADGMIRRLAIVEDSGQRRTLVFEAIEVNGGIPEGELRFRVPRGTRVVGND